MKIRCSWLLILSLICITVETTYAQSIIGRDQSDLSPTTPGVASMQKMVDVPVSYFTGAANLGIPLYVAHSKTIDVPVSLNYETSGIKADQKPSSVGLGWSLRAGGMISRMVVGNPDEGLVVSVGPGLKGGYYIDGSHTVDIRQLNTDVVSHNTYVRQGLVAPISTIDSMFNKKYDVGPDMFYYSFGDFSGKFFFGTNRTPILVPYNKDLKIVPVLHNTESGATQTNNYFDSWAISTPDGLTYYFGETAGSKCLITYSAFNIVRPGGWALTKIVNNLTKDSVVFTYNSVGLYNPQYARQAYVPQSDYNNCKVPNLEPKGGTASAGEAFISSIKTRTEQLNFYYSGSTDEDRTTRLDSIMVNEVNSLHPYKKVQLTYGYLLSGRLKLQEVLLMNAQHTQVLPYTFKYYDTTFQKVDTSKAGRTHTPIPYYNKYAQDFWGYYNDEVSHAFVTSLIMGSSVSNVDTSNKTCYAITRLPAFPQMQLDVLTEVTYPEGGKTRFTYEPHKVSAARMANGRIGDFDTYDIDVHYNWSISNIVGGLRLKRIEQIDPVKKDTLAKSFSYQVPGVSTNSSGYLRISPSLIADVTADISCTNAQNKLKYLISTQNMQSGDGTGVHVSYKNVTVAEDHNNINNGYTRYDFYDDTNTDSSFYFNVCDATNNSCALGNFDVLASWQERRPLENLLSGNLMSTSIYTSTNRLIRQNRNSYFSRIYPNLNRIVEFSVQLSSDVCDIPPIYDVAYSTPWNGFFVPPAGSYVYMHSYVIGKMAVLPQQTITDNYDSLGNKSTDTVRYYYESPNHVSQTRTKQTSSNTDSVSIQNIYSMDLADVNGTDSLGLQMRNNGVNMPLAQFVTRNGKIIKGGYQLYSRTSLQDPKSILLREGYVLLTNTGVAPTALNLTSTYPKTLNFPASYFQRVNKISYDNDNNVIQTIEKDQNVNGFIWAYNNSHLAAKVVNASSGEIAYTSFESVNNGNWTVPSAARSNTAFTGLTSYALGNGNITLTIAAPGKKMIVSYWSASTAATVNGVAATTGVTRNGWTYYQHILPETTTAITVSGSVTIDELRLYPAISQMTSFNYDPMLGVTAITLPDNNTTYYEYDSLQQITAVRDGDKHIVKVADYHQAGFNNTTATWRTNGQTRCKPCAANALYNSDTLQQLNVDLNIQSATWNTTKWVDNGKSSACPIVAVWSNTTTATRCVLDANSQQTGYQQQEQIDVNPCSPTYNTKQWVNISYNTVCVACQGTDRRIVNGVCETGHRINTASQAIVSGSKVTYNCTYHLEWSDCYKGPNIVQTGLAAACVADLSCSDW